MATNGPVPFAPCDESARRGGLILPDRRTRVTVGTGMIRFALKRATNLRWQDFEVTKALRARTKSQHLRCLG